MNRKRVLAINGSYRRDGITDQAVDHLLAEAGRLGAEVEHMRRRRPVEEPESVDTSFVARAQEAFAEPCHDPRSSSW